MVTSTTARRLLPSLALALVVGVAAVGLTVPRHGAPGRAAAAVAVAAPAHHEAAAVVDAVRPSVAVVALAAVLVGVVLVGTGAGPVASPPGTARARVQRPDRRWRARKVGAPPVAAR